jgi:hypothetical protein
MLKKISHNFIRTISILFGLFFILSFSANAQTTGGSYNFTANSGLSTTGNNAGYNLGTPGPEVIVSQVIQIILSLLGVIFLAFMMYAGITWMMAEGDEQKVQKAKDMISESIIGLIIVAAAYAISYFLINYFSANTLS